MRYGYRELYHYEKEQGTTTPGPKGRSCRRLYHYEKEQGTTTTQAMPCLQLALYHYEKEQGTTTRQQQALQVASLYHYEKEQGTTTFVVLLSLFELIIPLRERTGNHQNTPSKKDMLGRERIGPNPLQDGWGCAIMGTLERCQLGEWGLPRSFFYESSLVLSPTGGAGRFSDRFSSRAAGRREVFIVCLKSRI